MSESIEQTGKFRFGIGLGVGFVVFIIVSIFSTIIDGPLFLPIILVGFISGIIRPFVWELSSIISFSGGHFLVQWLFYSVCNVAEWRTSLMYAFIATICCLLGQLALQGKKKKPTT